MSKVDKNINKMMKIGSGVGTATTNTIKVGLGAIFSAVAFELTFLGEKMIEGDIETGKKMYKFKKDPDVYQVKDGWFKTKNVIINPVTGAVSDVPEQFKNKKPVNDKAFKL